MKTFKAFTLFLLLPLLLAAGGLFSCTEDEPNVFGNVHGYVSDEATGEPMRTASVTINPGGKKTVTGSDGRFEYTNLESGQYTLQIAKEGYQTNVGSVTIVPGQTAQCDILLRPGDGYLKVNKTEINMGYNNTLAAIEISNTGKIDLQWVIKKDCAWIVDIEPATGTTAAGKKSAVTIKIDRSKLEKGKTSSYSFIITSNAGAADVTIMASGEGATDNPDSPDKPIDPEEPVNPGDNVAAGLLAYYTFDNGDVKDATENKANGIAMNNPDYITNTPNGQGKAIFLNNVQQQYINIPYNVFKGLSTYSMSIWVKDFGSGYLINTIDPKSIYTQNDFPKIFAEEDGTFSLSTSSYKPAKYAYQYSAIQDEKWHLITVTVSALQGRDSSNNLYIDGQLVDSSSSILYANDIHSKIQIGGNADGDWKSFTASMKVDNVRFYNRMLTASEVESIYNYEKAQ